MKTNNVWLKGHTGEAQDSFLIPYEFSESLYFFEDIGSVTILWSQPVSALQILSPDGKWRWVKHIPNGLVRHSHSSIH